MRRNLARLCSFSCQCRIPRTRRAQTTFAAHTATDLPVPAPLPPKYSTAQSIHAAQTPDAFPEQTPERGSTKSTERPTKSNKVAEVLVTPPASLTIDSKFRIQTLKTKITNLAPRRNLYHNPTTPHRNPLLPPRSHRPCLTLQPRHSPTTSCPSLRK